TRTPSLRPAPGANPATIGGRWSIPARYSTTTPTSRRSSPQIFSTRSASWRPSTYIRLALATRARAAVPAAGRGAAIDPDAVRAAAAGPGPPGGPRPTRGTGPPSTRDPPRIRGETPRPPPPAPPGPRPLPPAPPPPPKA